jgi:hypothetical protein
LLLYGVELIGGAGMVAVAALPTSTCSTMKVQVNADLLLFIKA